MLPPYSSVSVTASQVALNPFFTLVWSLWKVMAIVFPELMIGLGTLDPQYFSSSDPKEI